MQSDLAHQTVHQERRARHVTSVLKETNEEEEQTDLRQENHHGADTPDDAFDEQTLEFAGRQAGADLVAKPPDGVLQQVHRQARERKDALENQRHQRHKNQQTPDAVGQHPV